MHYSAMRMADRFSQAYLKASTPKRVLEIGSQDVNGSLRQFFTGHEYIGVDFVQGKGVDVILSDPYKLPFEDASVDVVVSSSCFEHSEMFWLLYLEVLRILKPDGLFYLNVPSNGPFHRYPVDCWRFYPDSGNALVTWAERNGLKPLVLESFTARQEGSGWNDFVAVFVKHREHAKAYPQRISANYSGLTNLILNGERTVQREEGLPEDQRNVAYWVKKKKWRWAKRWARWRGDRLRSMF